MAVQGRGPSSTKGGNMLCHAEDEYQNILDSFGYIFAEYASYIRDPNTYDELREDLRLQRDDLRPILKMFEDFLDKYEEQREVQETV